MKQTSSIGPELNRLKSAIDQGLRAMRHPGTWAAATLAVGSGASAAPALEPATSPLLAPLDRSSSLTRSLVIVDPGVERAGVLLGGLPSNAAVIELGADRDPIAEIGRAVRMHRDIGEIHLLSHGHPGALELAGRRIDADALQARAGELNTWFADRDAAPAIVLYGCSSGAGDDGLALINTLARLTGASVSASDDATGRPADGGDWIFERATGMAARAPIFGEGARAEFEGLLATFTVNNTNDSGLGSLREAIADANAAPGADVIDLTGVTGTIELTSGSITISDEVEINGPGASDLTISGYYDSSIFRVDADTTINDVTLTYAYGSAIRNQTGNSLTITGTTISNSVGYYGGGVQQYGGELVIENSTITGNSAFFGGGGIRFDSGTDDTSLVEISNTQITDNYGYYAGGAVLARTRYGGGTLEVSDSTITGNETNGPGGGIALFVEGGGFQIVRGIQPENDLTISNTTISNNDAGDGGGVFVYAEGYLGDVEVVDSTIQNNSATSTNGGIQFRGGALGYGIGGGMFFLGDRGYGSLTISNTTISGNTAAGAGGVAVVFGNYGNPVSIEQSVISGNSADGGGLVLTRDRGGFGFPASGLGGGILLFNSREIGDGPYGSLTVTDSTISGNSAVFDGGGLAAITQSPFFLRNQDQSASARAGADPGTQGLSNPGTKYLSEIAIENTTISGNQSSFGTGGIAITAEAARGVALTNSTVSGNTGGSGAGGISVYGTGSVNTINRGVQAPIGISINLDLVTVANNTSGGNVERGVITSDAGGIWLTGDSDTATIRNSIVGDNTGAIYNDISGSVYADFSLIEDADGATIAGNDNVTGADAQLGPLADNGGPTATHLPGPASPALNAGDPAFSPPPASDQRGLPRVAGGTVDMGSVEVEAPNIAFDPDPLDFGSQAVGATSAAAAVTISNTGGPLQVTDIDAAAGAFADAGGSCSTPPFTLGDGESCTVTYTFSPTGTGPASQVIGVTSNDSDGPESFTVSGVGIAGALEITPSPVDFGGVTVGDTTAPLAATLSNTGDADILVSGLSGPAAPFALAGGTCGATPFTISPSASCTITATFSPTSPGVANGQVTVTSNSPSSPDELLFTGTGIAGEPEIGLNRNDVDFGTVELGVDETGIVTLTNVGTATLNISQITDPGAPFTLGFGTTRGTALCSTPPFDLAPAASCDIEVTFNPPSPGSFTASFDILSNAPSSPDAVALRGNAGAPLAIPVLGPWGLALLSGLMGLLGWLGLRRRGPARS